MMPKLSRLLLVVLSLLPFILGRLPERESRDEVRETANNENGSESDVCGCQNGGTCIIQGAFCHCPLGFRGRQCQQIATRLSCNEMSDGEVALDYRGSCQICICRRGTVICEDLYNCESLSLFTRSNAKFLFRNLKSQDALRSSSSRNTFNTLIFNTLLITQTVLHFVYY